MKLSNMFFAVMITTTSVSALATETQELPSNQLNCMNARLQQRATITFESQGQTESQIYHNATLVIDGKSKEVTITVSEDLSVIKDGFSPDGTEAFQVYNVKLREHPFQTLEGNRVYSGYVSFEATPAEIPASNVVCVWKK